MGGYDSGYGWDSSRDWDPPTPPTPRVTHVTWEFCNYMDKVNEWVDWHRGGIDHASHALLNTKRTIGLITEAVNIPVVAVLSVREVEMNPRTAKMQRLIDSPDAALDWLVQATHEGIAGAESTLTYRGDNLIRVARVMGGRQVVVEEQLGNLGWVERDQIDQILLGYFHHASDTKRGQRIAHHCYDLNHHAQVLEGGGSAPGDPAFWKVLDVRHCPCGKHVYAIEKGKQSTVNAYMNGWVPSAGRQAEAANDDTVYPLQTFGFKITSLVASCASSFPSELNVWVKGKSKPTCQKCAVRWLHLEGSELESGPEIQTNVRGRR